MSKGVAAEIGAAVTYLRLYSALMATLPKKNLGD